MIALALPWVILILFIIAILSFYRRRWAVGAALLIIGILVNWHAECIPFRLWPVNQTEGKYLLKVMSFNIDGSMERISNKAKDLADLIITQNPDIIFLLEFSELYPAALDTLLTNDYPYSTYRKQVYYSHYYYSKYPIVENKSLPPNDKHNNSVYYCNFDINGTILTLYGCHFPSNNYSEDRTYFTPDSVSNMLGLLTYFRDVYQAYQQRGCVADSLKKQVVKQISPVILLGDFNDVGGSSAVRVIESAGLKDAWWVGGFGYGATIHKPLPYRIDHIMYTKELELNRIEVVDSYGLSDHDALFAEFGYRKN